MDRRALIIAVIVALIIVIAGAVINYSGRGWEPFAYKEGDSPAWSGDQIANLRFRGATFSVQLPSGETRTQDVTEVLNGMAVAHRGIAKQGTTLNLDAPLNPFSFLISGFNDSKTVPDPTAAQWLNAKARLSGQYRSL